MAEDDTSTVWIDFNNNSPISSVKQLSAHLPENITHQQQLHDNNDNKPDAPPKLPHIQSQHYGIDEIKETFLPITPCDMPQYPKLDAYQSTDTINTPIIDNRSRTSSILESVPDHDSFPDIDFNNIIDAVINIEYATNPQHSQQIPPENNNNSNDSNDRNNDSNDRNNDSNNQNNKPNNNNNNQHNKNNNNSEKKRDNNEYGKEQHKYKQKVNGTDFIYLPHKIYKNIMGGNIRITKIFTQKIIPKNVKQKYIKNVYDFLYKCIAININDRNVCDCGNFMILNCRFQDISGQNLYCIADKSTHQNSNYSYVIRDKLYTQNTIASLIPKSGLIPISSMILTDDMHNMCNAFNNPARICQDVIFKTKWHKIRIFDIPNNKQRLTFSIAKTEFVSIIQKYIHNGNGKVLLPIIMFSDTYRVEYVQIVPLRRNIYIGIAYIYDKNGDIKVTGIHLNKNNLLLQHQLVDIEHNCNCLRNFSSDINCLHIGNPDDDKNRYNDLKKKHIELKNAQMQNKQLHDENVNIIGDNYNKQLHFENYKLKTEMNAIQTKNTNWNILCQKQNAKINVMQTEINRLKMQLLLNQQQVTQMHINATLQPISPFSNIPNNITVNGISTISPITNNIPLTPMINNYPIHSTQNSYSSTITNVTTPGSWCAMSSPQSSIGTPINNINMAYSQPNMNNNNSINAMNNINQRQVLISASDKGTTVVNNEKRLKNKNENYNDGNDANN